MSGRREVNVERPEHSWIPFYRELAEKLVEDGWRERQDKLVAMLKEMGKAGLPVPRPLRVLPVDHIDPFTFYAAFNAKMKPSNRGEIIFDLSRRFEIEADLKDVSYYVPDARPDNAIFFNWIKQNDYVSRIASHWDTFEFVLNAKPFTKGFDRDRMMTLMDKSLGVTGVGIPKLTGAFYWINPTEFLHWATINDILGYEAVKRDDDSSTYLNGLYQARNKSSKPFPMINDEMYLTNNEAQDQPKLWLVRGGSKRFAVKEFLSQHRIGIGFGMESVELEGISTRRGLEEKYRENRPDGDSRDVNQLTDFMLKIEVGDYVIMPDGQTTYCGMIVSSPYHRKDGPLNHSRRVNWNFGEIGSRKLPTLPPYVTVKEMDGELYGKFLSETGLISDDVTTPTASGLQIPEDSWVPFHLEVGRKLIEGEWWFSEKRQEFENMIDEIRWADPEDVGEDYEYERWTGDPFSFYLSFNMRTTGGMRVPAYRKIKELMQIEAEVPEEAHEATGLGVGWGWDPPLTDEGISFLWDFFRFAIDFEPASDSIDSERQFISFYDRAASASFLPGMRSRVLSYLLYWIDPTKYVLTRRLRSQELGLIADLHALDLAVSQELAGGTEYMKAVGGLLGMGRANGFTILDVNRKSTTRELLGLPPIGGVDGGAYTIDTLLNEGVFLEHSVVERMERILRSKRNLILQGPPGVGKTFIARKLAYVLMGEKGVEAEKRITSVQFHQSYSYEDFVGGFRPDVVDDQMVFTRQDGPFLRVCKDARENPDDAYVVLIDEINRGNLSRVFGELLMLIEADKRKPEFGVSLQHRGDDDEKFFVPPNVYIIGTMNLADRSLTGMNVAMRRRFGFVDLKPQFNERVFTDWLSNETAMPPGMRGRINTRMAALNSTIATDPSLGINYAVGHSFFCPPDGEPEGGWEEWYETVVEYEVRPLLREYWFDAPETANDHADELLAGD